MMWCYVKKDLGGRFGIPAGSVEKFAPHQAGSLIVEGAVEPFDPKNEKHATAPGAECVPREPVAAETPRARREKK
jgi:hypothetical protein